MVLVHDLVTDDLASSAIPVTVDNRIVQQVGEVRSATTWSVFSNLALDDRVCDGAGTVWPKNNILKGSCSDVTGDGGHKWLLISIITGECASRLRTGCDNSSFDSPLVGKITAQGILTENLCEGVGEGTSRTGELFVRHENLVGVDAGWRADMVSCLVDRNKVLTAKINGSSIKGE